MIYPVKPDIYRNIRFKVRRINNDIVRVRCHFKSFSRMIFLTTRFFAATCAVTFNFRFLITKTPLEECLLLFLLFWFKRAFRFRISSLASFNSVSRLSITVNKDLYMVIKILYIINKILYKISNSLRIRMTEK